MTIMFKKFKKKEKKKFDGEIRVFIGPRENDGSRKCHIIINKDERKFRIKDYNAFHLVLDEIYFHGDQIKFNETWT